jgi:hypothetical protein
VKRTWAGISIFVRYASPYKKFVKGHLFNAAYKQNEKDHDEIKSAAGNHGANGT